MLDDNLSCSAAQSIPVRAASNTLSNTLQADKSLQTADWRKRPLTKSMLTYARMDTHYLLYMADLLRVKLLKAQDKAPEKMKVQMPVQGPQVRQNVLIHYDFI